MCAKKDIPSHNGVDLRSTETIECIVIPAIRFVWFRDPAGNVRQYGHWSCQRCWSRCSWSSESGAYGINCSSEPHTKGICLSVTSRYVLMPLIYPHLVISLTDCCELRRHLWTLCHRTKCTSCTKTCNYNYTSRSCVLAGIYDLQAKTTIDFTFSLQPNQNLNFYYATLGS
jgi:hypothetical protein